MAPEKMQMVKPSLQAQQDSEQGGGKRQGVNKVTFKATGMPANRPARGHPETQMCHLG